MLKYVPVLRYRASEKKTLSSVAISSKILPLIEIVTEKPKQNSRLTCIQEIAQNITELNTELLIDFPMYITLRNNSIPAVTTFISQIQANPAHRITLFNQLVGLPIIPVITYNPNTLFTPGILTNEVHQLRTSFQKLAFRLFVNHFGVALNEIQNLLSPGDILILDIDTAPHSHPGLTRMYNDINSLAANNNSSSVLIRSAVNTDITNTGLTPNQIVPEADNSLLTAYSTYGFNAFGDYCGIKKDDLTKGGRVSPGCLFYDWQTNSYYGHRGIFLNGTTYTSMVTPSIINSQQWNNYTQNHKQNCHGCNTIYNISTGTEPGDSAPKWKIIMSSHYLHTMEEFL